MKYFISHEGINDDETLIECELQLGDYCSIDTDTGNVELKVVKRTYYPITEEWIFLCSAKAEG
jgi:hypothetical protein